MTRRTSIITIVVVSGITRRRRSQPPREGRPRRGELAAMRVFAVLTGVLSMTGTVAALPQDSADPPDQQNSERPSGVVGNVKDWLIPAGTAAAGVIAGWFGRGFSDKRRDSKLLPPPLPPHLPLPSPSPPSSPLTLSVALTWTSRCDQIQTLNRHADLIRVRQCKSPFPALDRVMAPVGGDTGLRNSPLRSCSSKRMIDGAYG